MSALQHWVVLVLDTSGVIVGWRSIGGLSNIYQLGEISGSCQIQLRNSSTQFYVGYLFEPHDMASTGEGTGKLDWRGSKALV